MNLSLQNIDKVSAQLTVKIEKADYLEKVEKSLKTIRQKVQMPGFRKGMVPGSLIKKMHGKSVMGEEINKLLSESVYGYIKENKIKILGDPLPNEEQQKAIDYETTEDFEFVFDLALVPEVKVEVSKADKVDYYTIEVTDEMVEEEMKSYTQRNGKHEKVESYQDKDMLKGVLTELDEDGNTKENGIRLEDSVLMPSYMSNAEQKAVFADSKVNDILTFNPHKAYEGNAPEISSLLHIDKDAVGEMKSDFSYQIEEITRYMPGELNQELFDQIYGKDVVKSEEEFRAKIKENIAARLTADSDYKFLMDAEKMLTEKVGDKMEFSENLLKRIMVLNSKDKSEEYVNEHFGKSIEALKWQLIKEQLTKDNEIKIEEEDVLNSAKESAKAQFARYGMMSVPDDLISSYAADMMKKKESINNLVNRAVEVKLTAILKNLVELNNKTLTREEFDKLFEASSMI